MTGFSEIIAGRSAPGILIFDMKSRLLYANKEALETIPDLQKTSKRGKHNIPKEIFNLCNDLIKGSRETRGTDQGMHPNFAILSSDSGPTYSIRTFFIGRDKDGAPTHIMGLIEKIVEKHEIDFEKVREKFKLSSRELEVLRLVCGGLANKEISERLFISEYTVKEHIKNIMRKMEVGSRSQIIASLK